jgi:hypothetical protein
MKILTLNICFSFLSVSFAITTGEQDTADTVSETDLEALISTIDPSQRDLVLRGVGTALKESSVKKRKNIFKEITEGMDKSDAIVDSLKEYTNTLETSLLKQCTSVIPKFSSGDIQNTKNFVRSKQYDPKVPPTFFKADGLKVSLKGALGALTDGELDEGVLIPGNRNPDGRRTHSLLATGSGTGFIGGWFSETMPL